MKALVTTLNHVYLFDGLDSKTIANGPFFGIARDDEFVYIAAKAGHSELQSEIHLLDLETMKWGPTLTIPFELRGAHGIHFAEDQQRLYITASYQDLIGVFDFNKGTWFRWYPIEENRESDSKHINALTSNDDTLYVTCHNHGQSEIREFTKSADTPKLKNIRKNIGRYCHDALLINDVLWWTDSSGCKIKNDKGFVHDTKRGFIRGLDINDKGAIAGSSKRVERAYRQVSNSEVLFYDSDWNLVRAEVVSGPVNDCLIISS